MYNRVRKSTSSNPVNQGKSSQFAPQRFTVQPKQETESTESPRVSEKLSPLDDNFANIPTLRPDAPVANSVQRMFHQNLPGKPIQAKLTIGEPGDKYEQEADRVATQVVQQINSPTTQSNQGQSLQRLDEVDEKAQAKPQITSLQRQKNLQRQGGITVGETSQDLETAINSARSGGQPLDAGLQQSIGRAMGADFSRVKIHTDTQSDQLNESIQAKAFTTGQDVFFRKGAYEPGSRGGQELIAHELTHVVQQGGNQIQAMSIQRTPEDIWEMGSLLTIVRVEGARNILEQDFYSNWFLAQEYLLDPTKWTNKNPKEVEEKSAYFKALMETLLKLREKETISKETGLLLDVRNELKKQEPFKNLPDEQVLDWGSAGSKSLTSDIDVNLKGAGSIQAVGLFNRLFKEKLGWALDPGTVYDVNVYAQDFMTPSASSGKAFDQDKKQNTITPVQEVPQLNVNVDDQSESLAFDAFALNQDVWSMLKMRIYMSDSEWQGYCQEMLVNARGDGSENAQARQLQIQAQIDDVEISYAEYKGNLEHKIDEIDTSTDPTYQKMRQELEVGKTYLSEHQQEASKKMIAANLIYEQKLVEVSRLRQELKDLQAEVKKPNTEVTPAKIKEVGINLKNALSEAILYSNEAYFSQGAVHFAVIGQQIGGGQSKLIMSEDEHLHSFREQVGDSLKVLNEYEKAPIDKAILKAGKYIDRMAKSAIPLIVQGKEPNGYHELAYLGAAAAEFKASKTEQEEIKNKPQADRKKEDNEKLSKFETRIPELQNILKNQLHFKTVPELRATIIAVGKQVEKDFRQQQLDKNAALNASRHQEDTDKTVNS